MNIKEFTKYDPADYLTSDEHIAAYMEAAVEDGDQAMIEAAKSAALRALARLQR